jgi:addiction module HigA family antidote
MLPTKRITTHPGEVLQEEFLTPLGLSQSALARHIGVKPFVVNELVHGKRSVSTRMAMMLAQAFGTTPGFWAGLQADHDMTQLLHSAEGERVRRIRPIPRD